MYIWKNPKFRAGILLHNFFLFTNFYAIRDESNLMQLQSNTILGNKLCRTQAAFWLRFCSDVGEPTSYRSSNTASIHRWTTVRSLSIPLPLHAPGTQFNWGSGSKSTRNTSWKGMSGKPSRREWRTPNNAWPCHSWSWFLSCSTFLNNLQ